jgi:hypothetical protein
VRGAALWYFYAFIVGVMDNGAPKKRRKLAFWNALWARLEVGGWRIEVGFSGNTSNQTYYMPRDVHRTDPDTKNRRDYFDSKVGVVKFLHETSSVYLQDLPDFDMSCLDSGSSAKPKEIASLGFAKEGAPASPAAAQGTPGPIPATAIVQVAVASPPQGCLEISPAADAAAVESIPLSLQVVLAVAPSDRAAIASAEAVAAPAAVIDGSLEFVPIYNAAVQQAMVKRSKAVKLYGWIGQMDFLVLSFVLKKTITLFIGGTISPVHLLVDQRCGPHSIEIGVGNWCRRLLCGRSFEQFTRKTRSHWPWSNALCSW